MVYTPSASTAAGREQYVLVPPRCCILRSRILQIPHESAFDVPERPESPRDGSVLTRLSLEFTLPNSSRQSLCCCFISRDSISLPAFRVLYQFSSPVRLLTQARIDLLVTLTRIGSSIAAEPPHTRRLLTPHDPAAAFLVASFHCFMLASRPRCLQIPIVLRLLPDHDYFNLTEPESCQVCNRRRNMSAMGVAARSNGSRNATQGG